MTTETLHRHELGIIPMGPRVGSPGNTECYRICTPERTLPYHFLDVEIVKNNGKYKFRADGEVNGYVKCTASDFPTNPHALEYAKTLFLRKYQC